MSVIIGFGGWIKQNIQPPSKAEAKRSENAKPNSMSEKDSNNQELYYDKEENEKQGKLWRAAEKKHPWYDAPPKVEMEKKNGFYHMKVEVTLGLPPEATHELLTNPNNLPLFSDKSWRQHLVNKKRKVVMKDGPRRIVELEKAVAWDFLWWSGAMPIHVTLDENLKEHTAKYKIQKVKFMKVFEGNYKIDPLYVDAERLCKHKMPKSNEEYKQCSDGSGKIASKVTMNQFFQLYPLFDLPPVSCYIRKTTIKTTKTLLKMLQDFGALMRV